MTDSCISVHSQIAIYAAISQFEVRPGILQLIQLLVMVPSPDPGLRPESAPTWKCTGPVLLPGYMRLYTDSSVVFVKCHQTKLSEYFTQPPLEKWPHE